eukprot:1194980-Alexandrium_andersonii.AAC.1
MPKSAEAQAHKNTHTQSDTDKHPHIQKHPRTNHTDTSTLVSNPQQQLGSIVSRAMAGRRPPHEWEDEVDEPPALGP